MRIDRWIMVRALAAVAIAGLLCTASAGFADTYIVTALTQGLNGSVHDISSTGAVCGGDNGRAFVWRPSSPNALTGTTTILPTLITNFGSDAYGVNASGLVVGHTGDNPLEQHEVPVVWNPDGSITKLPLSGVTSGGMATGINDYGQITGRNGLFTTDATVARWNADGTGIDIAVPSGFANSYGWKLNAGGAIAGTASLVDGTTRGFIYANGLFTFLPLLPGATLTNPNDINDAGHVVGNSSTSTASAFFYDGVAVRGLANVPGELIQVSTPLGLNNRDQIVGYGNASPNITNALIWESPDALPRHLTSLIDPRSPGYVDASNPGWLLTEAVAINDAGQIAARGVSTSGGSYKALLLTPVGVQANRAPVAVASGTPQSGPAPLTVQFSSAGSYDPDGSLVSYLWNFGDSSTNATEPNPSHTYTQVGPLTYQATLTVTDNLGARSAAGVKISITAPLPAAPVLHVQSQRVSRLKVGNKIQAQDVVLIADQLGAPVGGAFVTAKYTGPTQGTISGTTGANGQVVLKSTTTRRATTQWCFTVTSVSKEGCTYGPSANVVTQQCEPIYVTAAAFTGAWVTPVVHGSAEVRFDLAREAEVEVRIFDAAGRQVCVLEPRTRHAAGAISLRWDGRNEAGRPVSSGTYFIRFSAAGSQEVRKIIVLK